MSGKVTISTFYCIVSTSFYRLLFSKKAVFEAFIISGVGSEVGTFLSASVVRCGKERQGEPSAGEHYNALVYCGQFGM